MLLPKNLPFSFVCSACQTWERSTADEHRSVNKAFHCGDVRLFSVHVRHESGQPQTSTGVWTKALHCGDVRLFAVHVRHESCQPQTSTGVWTKLFTVEMFVFSVHVRHESGQPQTSTGVWTKALHCGDVRLFAVHVRHESSQPQTSTGVWTKLFTVEMFVCLQCMSDMRAVIRRRAQECEQSFSLWRCSCVCRACQTWERLAADEHKHKFANKVFQMHCADGKAVQTLVTRHVRLWMERHVAHEGIHIYMCELSIETETRHWRSKAVSTGKTFQAPGVHGAFFLPATRITA